MDLKRSYNIWRATRRTANELYRLTERELEDLGYRRDEIPAIARRAAQSRF